MNSTYNVRSAILFMVFNRPEQTARVFEEIRKVKPLRLYIAGDGAREDRPKEAEIVEEVRKIVLNKIDWKCDVHTLFRTKNLGCKLAVSTSIDWFFINEEEGIILEDDCLPSNYFFKFCDEMLEVYRSNKSIGMISGSNLIKNSTYIKSDYYYSKYVLIWGWASWRNRWSGEYDVDMKSWPTVKKTNSEWHYGDKSEVKSWSSIFDAVYNGQIDTWDYQWVFTNWINQRLNIVPRVNLISNIGFGSDATHTIRKTEVANLPRNTLNFPLKHPELISRNIELDHVFYKKHIYCHPIMKLIKNLYHNLKIKLFPLVIIIRKLNNKLIYKIKI